MSWPTDSDACPPGEIRPIPSSLGEGMTRVPRSEEAQWVFEIVDSLAYKPGWVMDVVDTENGPMLRLSARAIDSIEYIRSGRQVPTRITSIRVLAPYYAHARDRDGVVRVIRDMLIEQELHELDEFLRDAKTGQLVHDPHADPPMKDLLIPNPFAKGENDGGGLEKPMHP